jgi:steroid 5-alpha reductase family enzyme
MTPLLLDILLASGFAAVAWILSLATHDTSWVDRLWSIVPIIYVGVFALDLHLRDARLDVMGALVLLWGARLTFNFARKGGYSGVEDYRWAVLRSQMPRWRFQLFNVSFICAYQNVLLLLIALPAYTAFEHRASAFAARDVLLAAVFLACLAGETVADQQQWDFHQLKARMLSSGATPDPAFLTTGLFRVARHPNYFFEIAQWWLLFLLGASAAGSLAQWTILGPALLTLLFVGSTRFTERITLSKYPAYAQYQRRTSPVIPWFPRESEGVIAEREAT